MQEIINKRLRLGRIWLSLVFVFAAMLFISIFFMSALLIVSIYGFMISLPVYLLLHRQLPNSLKMLESIGMSSVIDEFDLERATLPRSAIYCGPRAFYSEKSQLILPYSEILWIHQYQQSVNGIPMVNYTAVYTRDGKRYRLKAHREELIWLLENYILKFSPEVQVGYGPEQKDIYAKNVTGKSRYVPKKKKPGRPFFIIGAFLLLYGLAITIASFLAPGTPSVYIGPILLALGGLLIYIGKKKNNSREEN